MDDEEFIDDVLESSVDSFLTPPTHIPPSPTVSSGFSLVGAASAAGFIAPKKKAPVRPEDNVEKYICAQCGKVYSKKSKRHYLNHVFLHNIADANIRRPTISEVIPFVDEYLLQILREISEEQRIPEDKLSLVQELMNSKGSDKWASFSTTISSGIVDCLTKRVKVMPASQYEELLSALNHKLNDRIFFNKLKLLCLACVGDKFQDSVYLGVIVFRISFCLCEKIQLLIMKEMRGPDSNPKTAVTVEEIVGTVSRIVSSPEENIAFEGHMSKLVRNYYYKISQFEGPVWSVRAMCIRKEFVVSSEEDFVSHKSMTDATLWLENILQLNENVLNFFLKVEEEIRKVLGETSSLSKETILEKISKCPQQLLLNDWCLLTLGYFSEQDALTFMRDILSIVINLSIRFEQKRMFALEQRNKSLQQFALRTNLKRN